MEIRQAKTEEFSRIMEIYRDAQVFMREQGNPNQWKNLHPTEEMIREDLKRGRCHVCVEDDSILGVFYFAIEEDPTYQTIENGAWLNQKPYGVIHRIAVAARGRGVAGFCFDYAYAKCGNVKIDTHEQNLPMQKALAKNGFSRCGIIYLKNGEPRIAYQKA